MARRGPHGPQDLRPAHAASFDLLADHPVPLRLVGVRRPQQQAAGNQQQTTALTITESYTALAYNVQVTQNTSLPQTSSEDPTGLLRQLGIISATALVVSNMVGTGIFTTSGFLAGDLGAPSLVLIIWVVGALFALVGAFCYSELGVNFPSSGGEYVYLTRAYGPTWGFMSGWVSFFAGFSAPIAAAALAFSDYLGYFFPALKQANAQFTIGPADFSLKLGGAQLAASVLIALFTVLNFFGVRRVARMQNVLTATKILVLVAFIGLGFAIGTGSWGHFSMSTARTSTTSLPAQFAISLFWIYVAYSGWNAATYVAEELKQPEKTLPVALAVGAGLVAALYLGLNLSSFTPRRSAR